MDLCKDLSIPGSQLSSSGKGPCKCLVMSVLLACSGSTQRLARLEGDAEPEWDRRRSGREFFTTVDTMKVTVLEKAFQLRTSSCLWAKGLLWLLCQELSEGGWRMWSIGQTAIHSYAI